MAEVGERSLPEGSHVDSQLFVLGWSGSRRPEVPLPVRSGSSPEYTTSTWRVLHTQFGSPRESWNRQCPDPLKDKVLDPACGSGTFLFHAVRRYLDAALVAGHSNERAVPPSTPSMFSEWISIPVRRNPGSSHLFASHRNGQIERGGRATFGTRIPRRFDAMGCRLRKVCSHRPGRHCR